MANLSLSVAPGYYLEAQQANWVLSSEVDFISFALNGAQPALSKYIAYDTLTPANPFIAVTEDGNGRVVYDGGFPKFYNNSAPAAGATFSQLTAAYKYLYNAILWVAKAGGAKKILILGDAIEGQNYKVKGTGANDFNTSLTNLCTAVGFTPTFKDRSDYTGALLNATLAEMNQYDCVLVMSSVSTGELGLTTSMIQDIQTYRQQGGGVILITDHGPVINDISGAYPPSGASNQFFTTANAIAVNFGAWFSGNFDRTPVNVGFLRTNYGDHPLYDGMADTESIAAGTSESKVIVSNPPQYRPPIAPVTISKQGVNTLRAMAQLKDGTMEAYSFVYVIATGQLILFKDGEGVEINALPTSLSSKVDFDATLVGAGLGTLSGDIQLNGVTVAQLAFTEAEGSSSAWIGGGSNQLFVKKGDVFKARITSPFSYTRDLPVNRLVPTLTNLRKLPDVVKELRNNGFSTSKPKETVLDAVNYMTREFPALGYTPKGDYARDIAQLQGFWSTEPTKPDQGVYIYQTLAQAQEAMGRLSPPTPQQVFNTWDRFTTNDYFVGGVGATGDAASWAWNDSLGAAVQSVNSATWNGFISPDVVDSYELDVVIKSDNADDDTNGIILAFNRANGVNHRLILALNQGGNAPAASHSIGLYSTSTQHLVLNDFAGRMSNAAFPADGGWRGKFSRVKVTRSGNYFKVLASQWNSLILDPASLMELTLDDTALQAQFKGPKPWGFINYSQSQSYFTLRSYKGGPLKDVVVVAATGAVYFYGKSGWELIAGTTAKDVFGYPRKLTNPETGASFMVNANGTITAL